MTFRFGFASLLVLALPCSAFAQWAAPGTPVATSMSSQHYIRMVSDGAGGAILAWDGSRTGGSEDIYAQRISSAGVPMWTANGVSICTANGFQYYPEMASDGAGGAIITWMDTRNGGTDIYAQRVNASGTPLWTADGIVVCDAVIWQEWPTIDSDGSGGALITWSDNRNNATNSFDIYVQRINSSGTPVWTANGVPVAALAAIQDYPDVVSDGAGGAIVTWRDLRGGGVTQPDIYAQRVNSAGTPQWTANGIPVCASTGNQENTSIIMDGVGGAIIAWYDYRSGSTNDIYAQRLNNAGTALWSANGASVCSAPGYQPQFNLISDGAQGAFFAWTDSQGPDDNVYAQRISSGGKPLWLNNGIPVCTAAGFQGGAPLVSDGAGGVIIAWGDGRTQPSEIYGQRIDVNGTAMWTADGVRLTVSTLQKWDKAMVSDGNGNAIVGWFSYNPGESSEFAQRIDGRYGYWGKPEPTLYAVKDVPADQGGKVRVEWYASGRDVLNQNVITHYTIWRAIDQAAFATAATAGVPVVTLGDVGTRFQGKAIRREKAQAVDYFWELVGQQDAFYRYAYAFTAKTSFDSTAVSPATHRFQVASHASSSLVNWPSNVLAGRSVDNLAPPPPLALGAQRIGNYVYLKWNRVRVPDLDKYTVYRATSSGVTPIPSNFLTDDDDTLLTDTTAPTNGAVYYIVTATDIHDNQGAKSNEASVGPATTAGNLPQVTALTVLQNHPNPFSTETTFSVGLPSRADVSIEVYDVAGRRVRALAFPKRAKGWSTIRLDNHGDSGALLPSGVYFYRVRAGAEVVTNKMVIAR